MKKQEEFAKQNSMNEKLKYKYVNIKEQLIDLEDDVKHSVKSQLEMLA